MKLCPKCEFIYEDDQRFCDMDGEGLVEDTRAGVFPATVPGKAGAGTTKSRARIFVVPVIAGLALSLILSLVYYASSAPLDSKFEPTGQKPQASETSLQQSVTPLENASSQPAVNPSQSPASPEAGSESVSSGAVQLTDKAAESARSQAIAKSKAGDNSLKGGDNKLGIPRHLPPLPQLTPLPRVPSLRRLPSAQPEARTPGSPTPRKQQNNQKSAGTNRKVSVVDVKPDRGDARSRVGTFLKKTGRLLKKPFQL